MRIFNDCGTPDTGERFTPSSHQVLQTNEIADTDDDDTDDSALICFGKSPAFPFSSITLQASSIRLQMSLTRPCDILKEWRDDYEAMRSTMVFGPSLAFNALIERLHLLEERFHQ